MYGDDDSLPGGIVIYFTFHQPTSLSLTGRGLVFFVALSKCITVAKIFSKLELQSVCFCLSLRKSEGLWGRACPCTLKKPENWFTWTEASL